MERRKFVTGLALAPIATAPAIASTNSGERLYTEDEVIRLCINCERRGREYEQSIQSPQLKRGYDPLVSYLEEYKQNWEDYNAIDRRYIGDEIDGHEFDRLSKISYEKRWAILDKACQAKPQTVDGLKAQFEIFMREFSGEFKGSWESPWSFIVDNLSEAIQAL